MLPGWVRKSRPSVKALDQDLWSRAFRCAEDASVGPELLAGVTAAGDGHGRPISHDNRSLHGAGGQHGHYPQLRAQNPAGDRDSRHHNGGVDAVVTDEVLARAVVHARAWL